MSRVLTIVPGISPADAKDSSSSLEAVAVPPVRSVIWGPTVVAWGTLSAWSDKVTVEK